MATTRRCQEKLNSAIYALAVREGDVRQRLRGAYFFLRQLSDDEIPERLQMEFRSVLASLTRRGPEVGPAGEIYKKAFDNTLDQMRNSTGRSLAERIFALYREIR